MPRLVSFVSRPPSFVFCAPSFRCSSSFLNPSSSFLPFVFFGALIRAEPTCMGCVSMRQDHVNEIVGMVYQYLTMIREEGVQVPHVP